MICRTRLFALVVLSMGATHSAQAFSGAAVPWTTYEAENMTISGGTVLGPQYGPNVVASESSGRECVQLNGAGQYVQFTAQAAANSIVVRYSVPDTANGTGANYTISLYTNGVFVEKLPVTSMYSWLYGAYPFTNTRRLARPEIFTTRFAPTASASTRVMWCACKRTAPTRLPITSLTSLTWKTSPHRSPQPANSLSIMSYGAGGTGATDDTTPLDELHLGRQFRPAPISSGCPPESTK